MNVAIVEDDTTIREGLSSLINQEKDFQCIATFGSAEDALERFPSNVDVVLMDVHLPQMSGIECVQELKKKFPRLQIMMLTSFSNDEVIFDSLTAGASGYILKKTSSAEILEAIRELHGGGSPMSREIARKVVQVFHHHQEQVIKESSSLSKREEEILSFLAKGFRYKEIASKLNISAATVRNHLHNIYEKLHVTSRTEAVVKYLQ